MLRRNPPAHASKPAYHHGDLANALVDAAQRLIEAGGSSRLTLRAAAQAACVSAAAPYRHFDDREALLAAVLAKGFRELAQGTDAARRAAADPLSGLLAVGQAYVAFAAARPAIYRLMFGPECDKASHPTLMAAGQEALAVLTQAVLDCRLAGVIEEADVAPVVLAAWSLSHGLASLQADGLLATVMPGDIHVIARTVMQTALGAWRNARAPDRGTPSD
jgi:AcrR family transcriptional regulator